MPEGGDDHREEAIRQELERVLAGAALSKSPQLKAMLRYLVTETLAGRSAQIKAFNIAVDVFGRATSFDPATDPIVRVQAGRLRSALASHYNATWPDAGAPAPRIRIELPKGTYVPVFTDEPLAGPRSPEPDREAELLEETEAPEAPEQTAGAHVGSLEPTRGWRPAYVVGAAAVLALIVALVVSNAALLRRPDATPQVNAMLFAPVHSISEADEDKTFAKALTAEVATALSRTGLIKLRLAASEVDASGAELRHAANAQNFRWGLSGVMHRSGERRRAYIYLVDMVSGDVIWSQNYDATPQTGPDGLADSIILDLRPEIYTAAKHALEGKANPSPDELFMLATWFPGAEVNSLAWQLERVALARRAIARAPQSGQAYSVLADKLTLLATLDPAFDTDAVWKEAADAAREARVKAPRSPDVAFNIALYFLHTGDLTQALQAVRRTLELAPRHTLARFWNSVLPYTCSAPPQETIDDLVRYDAALSPSNPVRWQTQAWLARLYLNKGDDRLARAAAQRSMDILPNLGAAILFTVAAVQSGDVPAARRVFEAQQKYWKTFSFEHYNAQGLARVCAGSPLGKTMLKLHAAAAAAVSANANAAPDAVSASGTQR